MFILMLYIYLGFGLPSGVYPSWFPTRNLYTFLFSPIRATWTAELILLDIRVANIPKCYSATAIGTLSIVVATVVLDISNVNIEVGET
jgi:hypothetical protein